MKHLTKHSKLSLLVLLSTLLASALCGLARAAESIPHLEGLQPAQWRMVWKSEPATQATISWSTGEAGQSHRVRLLRGEEAWQTVECQRNGKFTGSDSGVDKDRNLFYHHARLTGLEPNTQYRVILESDGHRSPEMNFITAPREDMPLAILFGGDSRSGHDARKKVNRLIARLVAEQTASGRAPIVAFAHGGDYVHDGRILGEWSRWMTDHQLTVGAKGRLLPIIPTRGNHDVGAPFNEVFDFPVDDKNFYATNIGPQLRMITLNTETTTAGRQAEWLEAELRKSRPTHRWLLTQYHRPAFPAVKVPSGAYTNWVPLFEKYNLDMACEADGHNIKRTAPIRDNKIDATGVVYIGEGGLGVGQRTPKVERWYLRPPHAKVGSEHHVQMITTRPGGLTCRVILLDGSVFDETTLVPRSIKNRNQKVSNSN